MTKFDEMYRERLMTPEQAIGLIKDGDLIATGNDALEPMTTLYALHGIQERINEVTVYIGACTQDYPFMVDPAFRDKFKVQSRFFAKGTRDSHKYGNVSLIPLHMHACITRYAEVWKPDVIITSGCRMDKHGYINLALGGWDKYFIPNARAVIVEIVDDMPNVPGEYELHISEITAVIESGRTTPNVFTGTPNETDLVIGRYVAELVPDRATIQLGIGRIPDAVAQAFHNKHDLGVHTELLTNTIADLAEQGVITNKYKTLHQGKTIGSFCIGNRKLYDYMDCNPSIYMMPIHYVNDPHVIAMNDNMVSINTCIEVDLTGQIASESIGTRQFSGTGGQNDFAEGAIHSRGGKSIIAMHSSGVNSKGERFSKIKSILTPGAIVTMSRNNIDYIVTEYGIAYMKGQTIRSRVENLIAVAHPDFRPQLREEAERYGLW